jgi:hypothetical protein
VTILCKLLDSVAAYERSSQMIGNTDVPKDLFKLFQSSTIQIKTLWEREDSPSLLRSKRQWDNTLSAILTAVNGLSATEHGAFIVFLILTTISSTQGRYRSDFLDTFGAVCSREEVYLHFTKTSNRKHQRSNQKVQREQESALRRYSR